MEIKRGTLVVFDGMPPEITEKIGVVMSVLGIVVETTTDRKEVPVLAHFSQIVISLAREIDELKKRVSKLEQPAS